MAKTEKDDEGQKRTKKDEMEADDSREMGRTKECGPDERHI